MDEQSRNTLSSTLDVLLNEVQCLRSGNYRKRNDLDWQQSPRFPSTLWSDFVVKRSLRPEMLQKRGVRCFEEIMRSTHQLASVIELLDMLRTRAAGVRIATLSGLMSVGSKFGRLLLGLPAEILAETMRHACSDVYDLIKLSHVNRYFRETALSIFDIWNRVSSDMPKEMVQICLAKGKNTPVHVVFDDEDNKLVLKEVCRRYNHPDSPWPDSRSKTFVVEVTKAAPRWKAMKIILSRTNRWLSRVDGNPDISSDFLDLHVSRLESLSMTVSGAPLALLPFDSEIPNDDWVHFYRSWKAPNLRTLSFSGVVPMSIRGTSIKDLSLDFRALQGDMNFLEAIRDLLVFLRETSTLQKMTLYSYSRGRTRISSNLDLPTVDLESLESLTFIVDQRYDAPLHIPQHSSVPFTSFVDRLTIPNLASFELKLASGYTKYMRNSDISELVDRFIPHLGPNPPLKTLSVFVFNTAKENCLSMGLALDKFPSLRSLTVGITGEIFVATGSTLHPEAKRCGTLEHVQLLGCSHGAESFLMWVTDQLGEGTPGGGGARKLNVSVKGCGGVKQARLLQLLSAKSLHFEKKTGGGGDVSLYILEGYGFYCGDDAIRLLKPWDNYESWLTNDILN